MVGVKCCVPLCNNTGKRRFRFPNPKNDIADEIYSVWLNNINRPDLFEKNKNTLYKCFRVCDRHFEKNSVGWNKKYCLSAPTLHLPPRNG